MLVSEKRLSQRSKAFVVVVFALAALAATVVVYSKRTGADALLQSPFVVVRTSKTWSEARQYCQARGMDLADIRNAQENAQVRQRLNALSVPYAWIGLNDRVSEGSFKWADGSRSAYRNWAPGQPDNAGGGAADCGEIYRSGRWKDYRCTYRQAFVCAKARFVAVRSSKSWTAARQYCRSKGMQLATIHNARENAAVRQLLRSRSMSYAWMGLNDRSSEGSFKWDDGSVSAYRHWATGQPDNAGGGAADCGEIYSSGFWKDWRCSYQQGFVCSRHRGSAPAAATSRFVAVRSSKSWTAALQFCRQRGMRLATIHSAQENAEARQLLVAKGMPYAWMGLNDRASEGSFKWSDGSRSPYTHWAPGQPDNAGGGAADCGEIYKSGFWKDWRCSYTQGFLCAKARFVAVTTRKTWAQAKAHCQSLGLQLATIRTVQENAKVRQLLVAQSIPYAWIGLNDRASEGSFKWVDGSLSAYRRWATGQPDNSGGGSADCGEIYKSGYWKDYRCTYPQGFVCGA